MDQFTAKLIDISQWSDLPSSQTEGTRDKRKVLSPNEDKPYYFKTSFKRGSRDYRAEFWSEVIASRIGHYLGFEVLQYDVAIIDTDREQLTGCISPSLFDERSEEMISGYSLIVQITPEFSQRYKEEGFHSLTLIAETLRRHALEHQFKKMLQMWLFDVIIGNGDRHSENWAIVGSQVQSNIESKLKIEPQQLGMRKSYTVAPIYDSGSSLGREIQEDKICAYLQDRQRLEQYIDKAKVDISVCSGGSRKVRDNLETFIRTYHDQLIKEFQTLISRGQEEALRQIVCDIDKDVCDCIPVEHRLSQERKELIVHMVTARLERIKKAIVAYGI